jgi:hypothetical protein
VFTKLLLNNDRKDIYYRRTDWWEGFIKYTVEMGSDAMIYIPSFIKTGSGIQKLMRRDIQTHRQQGYLISLLIFLFKTRTVR